MSDGQAGQDPTADDTDAFLALDDTGPTRPKLPTGSAFGLRRRRGLLGDVRYLVAAFFGLSRARRERDRLEERLTDARARRDRAVLALAAQAVSTASLEHPALDEARAALAILDDDHGEHRRARGEVDGAAFSLRRQHEEHSRARLTEITDHERTLAELAQREAPLERDAARVRRRLDDLTGELARLDAAQARLESQRERRPDERAALDAELASGRANRETVARDRPALEAELAAIMPRLSAIEAARAEAQARLDSARTAYRARAEQLDGELRVLTVRIAALDRAGEDVRATREAMLAALGERLVLERPAILTRPLAELDDLDVAIATDQRRLLDLDELIDGADRRAMARGTMVLLALLTVVLTIVWLLHG